METTAIIGYYSRLVMAKNQGHFAIAKAFLALMESATGLDSAAPDYHKAMEKIAQAKGHAASIAASVETSAEVPAGEAYDWQSYILENPPYTRKLALALAAYFARANLLETAYEMYLCASELDEDGSSAQELEAIGSAESGTMAYEFGTRCESAGDYAKAAAWYKKAKDAGLAQADTALARMQSYHGVTRFITPWLEIAKKTGRKELAKAIVAMAQNANAGSMDTVTINESVVMPCYQELDFWESELDAYFKFSGDNSEAYGNAIAAIGRTMERARMYNVAIRWYKKAGSFSKAANDDARRMLPLKSKSITMREADDIYDSVSPIPALWKIPN